MIQAILLQYKWQQVHFIQNNDCYRTTVGTTPAKNNPTLMYVAINIFFGRGSTACKISYSTIFY